MRKIRKLSRFSRPLQHSKTLHNVTLVNFVLRFSLSPQCSRPQYFIIDHLRKYSCHQPPPNSNRLKHNRLNSLQILQCLQAILSQHRQSMPHQKRQPKIQFQIIKNISQKNKQQSIQWLSPNKLVISRVGKYHTRQSGKHWTSLRTWTNWCFPRMRRKS